METQESRAEIVLSLDTHLEVHVGAVINATGRVLGTLSVGTHNEGYKQLLCWVKHSGCCAALALKAQALTVQL